MQNGCGPKGCWPKWGFNTRILAYRSFKLGSYKWIFLHILKLIVYQKSSRRLRKSCLFRFPLSMVLWCKYKMPSMTRVLFVFLFVDWIVKGFNNCSFPPCFLAIIIGLVFQERGRGIQRARGKGSDILPRALAKLVMTLEALLAQLHLPRRLISNGNWLLSAIFANDGYLCCMN